VPFFCTLVYTLKNLPSEGWRAKHGLAKAIRKALFTTETTGENREKPVTVEELYKRQRHENLQ
jgi:hypothetical protein